MVGPECQKELNESQEYSCLASGFTAADYKEKCPIILSDVCNKFFANPQNYFPKCKDEKILQSMAHAVAFGCIHRRNHDVCVLWGR